MGLPMGKLVVATNANDILARFWKSGLYEKIDSTAPGIPAEGASDGKQAAHGVRETLSPAMDILVSSNFERLLWYLAHAIGEDRQQACTMVQGWMASMSKEGRAKVPMEVLEFAREDFLAERVGDELVRFSLLILKC